MNIAVIYGGMTGHSKKIAKAVADALGTQALNVRDKPELGNTDILFAAGGIYGGACHPELTEYAKTLSPDKVKRAVLMTSSCFGKSGQDEIRKILTDIGIKADEEEYRCFGGFLFVKIGHPNKTEIDGAVKFAKSALK
ncbi:MAG: hypothetical protein LBR54_00155 [Oscillospiraceae bacterium]|jgi:flavodoxin|nr:hypothetical protein [Oscillospiraceae bacterium]